MKITNLPLPASPQRSSVRTQTIQFTVSHHMTIVGRGDGLALEACRATWRTRQASAHYGVDGKRVARFVPDSMAAWATADRHGNHAGVSIEHANSTGGPRWRLAADTLTTGARLVAELHVKHRLGRPVKDVTMRRHSDFFPTACPGPFFADAWSEYVRQAQQFYDQITGTGKDEFDMASLDDLRKIVREEVRKEVADIQRNAERVAPWLPGRKGVAPDGAQWGRVVRALNAASAFDADALAVAIAGKLPAGSDRDLETTKRAIREVLTEGVGS